MYLATSNNLVPYFMTLTYLQMTMMIFIICIILIISISSGRCLQAQALNQCIIFKYFFFCLLIVSISSIIFYSCTKHSWYYKGYMRAEWGVRPFYEYVYTFCYDYAHAKKFQHIDMPNRNLFKQGNFTPEERSHLFTIISFKSKPGTSTI